MSRRHTTIAGVTRHMHGWIKGSHDPSIPLLCPSRIPLPSALDLRSVAASWMPGVRDQGDIGSCTANAGSELMGYVHRRLFGGVDPVFSALDLYAAVRTFEGTPLSEDSGAQIADIMRVLKKSGVCLDTVWPYVTSMFNVSPPTDAVRDAQKHLAMSHLACPSLDAVKASIAQKWAVEIGFTCYESLQGEAVAKTGHVPFPQASEQVIGGHAVLAVGYSDSSREVIFQNSWGQWGEKGYGYLPYAYFDHGLADDFHTIHAETK